MSPNDPQVCGACARAALTAPCSRGCKRLALVCGCAEVLALDGVCVVCARTPRDRVEVDVIFTREPGSRLPGADLVVSLRASG
jgi:hypothetical protein